MAYDNTNRGVLFKNEAKKSENHPDYSGNINYEGQDCFLDAWIKTAESGRKFMSLSIKPKQKQAPQGYKKPSQDAAKARQLAPQRAAQGSGFDDIDSDIPF